MENISKTCGQHWWLVFLEPNSRWNEDFRAFFFRVCKTSAFELKQISGLFLLCLKSRSSTRNIGKLHQTVPSTTQLKECMNMFCCCRPNVATLKKKTCYLWRFRCNPNRVERERESLEERMERISKSWPSDMIRQTVRGSDSPKSQTGLAFWESNMSQLHQFVVYIDQRLIPYEILSFVWSLSQHVFIENRHRSRHRSQGLLAFAGLGVPWTSAMFDFDLLEEFDPVEVSTSVAAICFAGQRSWRCGKS